jgi:pyruvate formate lyase activating enzyme
MHLASNFLKKEDNLVKCLLCPHTCSIPESKAGICRVRVNKHGNLYSLNYGKITAFNVDPIEKKPLYHFLPGSDILSLGTYGCNLHCDFCQNWQIAHQADTGRDISPKEVKEIALKYYVNQKSVGVAYTYSEPGMWYEFIMDTASLIKQNNMVNVLITNGYLNPKPFRELIKEMHAVNIDVKGFTDTFYKKAVKGSLKPVLDNCIITKEMNCHLEITTLIIPGLNDDQNEITALAKWIASLDDTIPLHLSRYYPNYKMSVRATPLDILEKAYQIASEHLKYVYIGNAPELNKSNTTCPECGEIIIRRSYYNIEKYFMDGKCNRCGKNLSNIIFE